MTTYQPLYCNAWSCDVCQPRRRARLFMEAQAGTPDTFITLTCNPAVGESPEDRAVALSKAWRVIVRRAKARYGYKSLPYLCVFESTIKGEPHLHILARCKWIGQAWLSAQMAALTQAPVCGIERIKKRQKAASYVAKYVGKEPHHFGGTKRYWRSLDYLTPDLADDTEIDDEGTWWSTNKWSWKLLATLHEKDGHDVKWHKDRAEVHQLWR